MLDKSIPVLLRTLEERQNTGRPYKDPILEHKRKGAISYLRNVSLCGWQFDKGKKNKKPAPPVVLRSVG